MRIGITLRHYAQHQDGVKHYAKTLFPQVLIRGPQHRFVCDWVA